MRFGIMMTLWGRPEIARSALRRTARAAVTYCAAVHEGAVQLVAAASENTLAQIAHDEGWQVVRVENQPLGHKHNVAMRELEGVDAAIVIGSDNWICDALLPVYMRRFHDGARSIGVNDVYNVCTYDDAAIHFQGYVGPRAGQRLGVGQALHQGILNALDWTPWDPEARASLDFNLRTRIAALSEGQRFPAHQGTMAELGITILGIKSAVNMTPFDAMLKYPSSVEVDRAAVLANFAPDEVRDLLAHFDTVPNRERGTRLRRGQSVSGALRRSRHAHLRAAIRKEGQREGGS